MFLTVCTPTYNRAYTLDRVYESLLKQSNKDFEWIIIDDGSTDETKQKVKKYEQEGKIKIKYVYQQNQGKHIALNNGVSIAKGELFTCLDSDDWFYLDTIETIQKVWADKSKDNIAGVIGLDTFENEENIGTRLPENLESENWINLIFKHHIKGDKAYFFKLDVIREYNFPSYPNNRHMPPSYQYYLLSEKYDLLLINKNLKFVEYLDDGISKNKFNKYVVAPDNFARYRFEIMDLIPGGKRKIINAIHFNSSLYLGRIKLRPSSFGNKLLVTVTKPFGYLLAFYINRKVNKNENIAHKI